MSTDSRPYLILLEIIGVLGRKQMNARFANRNYQEHFPTGRFFSAIEFGDVPLISTDEPAFPPQQPVAIKSLPSR